MRPEAQHRGRSREPPRIQRLWASQHPHRGPVESAPGAARARTVPGCPLTLMLLKIERDQRPARPEEASLPWRAPGLGRSPMVAGNREARAG